MRLPESITERAILMLAVATALVALWGSMHININYLEKIPHVQDSVNYLFQAQLFGMGKTYIEAPDNVDSFASEHIIVQNNRWYCHYPFLVPLLFMFGMKLGATWLINPLIAMASVMLIYLIGRENGSPLVGLWAAIFLTSSPFFMVMSASFMSHPTGLFLTALCLLLFLRVLKTQSLKGTMLLGLSIGMLFNTRPLTGFAIGLTSFCFFIRNRDLFRKKLLKQLTILVLCSAIGVGVFFTYSSHLSGKLLQFATHTKVSDQRGPSKVKLINRFVNSFAAAGVAKKGHSPERGLGCVKALVELYHTYSLNWPGWFNLSFMLIPFIFRRNDESSNYLLWAFISIPALYSMYWRSAIMYGPRYIYEILPMTVLLSAKGLDTCLSSADWLHRNSFMRQWNTRVVAKVAAALVLYGFTGWLIYTNVNQFFLKSSYSLKDYPPVSLVPMKLSSMKNFNGIRKAIPDRLDELGIDNGIVFVDNNRWQGFGSVSCFNHPTLDTDIVYAKFKKPRDVRKVMDMFPDRDYYYTKYPVTKIQTLVWDETEQDFVKTLIRTPAEIKKAEEARRRQEEHQRRRREKMSAEELELLEKEEALKRKMAESDH